MIEMKSCGRNALPSGGIDPYPRWYVFDPLTKDGLTGQPPVLMVGTKDQCARYIERHRGKYGHG